MKRMLFPSETMLRHLGTYEVVVRSRVVAGKAVSLVAGATLER